MHIWKITDQGATKVDETKLKEEDILEENVEDWILEDPSIIEENLLILGNQVQIPDLGDRIDILALDPQGNSVIIEIKRGSLKDPVHIQALRYASYVAKWGFQDFENQAKLHIGQDQRGDFNFNETYENFCVNAGQDEIPDINGDQRIILVGSKIREKLGSVALWLLEHNVDIKVIQIDLFRDGDSNFLQPQTIIPLPVSSFSETGKIGEGIKPWKEDGRSWHLEKRCSQETKEIFLQLNEIITENLDVDGPGWVQKFYVAYRIENYNWLNINTGSTILRLHFKVKTGEFNQHDIANRLGVQEFDPDDSLSDKFQYSSSVYVEQRNESTDNIKLRVKDDFNIESEEFLKFLNDAYKACPRF